MIARGKRQYHNINYVGLALPGLETMQRLELAAESGISGGSMMVLKENKGPIIIIIMLVFDNKRRSQISTTDMVVLL